MTPEESAMEQASLDEFRANVRPMLGDGKLYEPFHEGQVVEALASISRGLFAIVDALNRLPSEMP